MNRIRMRSYYPMVDTPFVFMGFKKNAPLVEKSRYCIPYRVFLVYLSTKFLHETCLNMTSKLASLKKPAHNIGEGRIKWASRPKSAPSVIAFLVYYAVKSTVVVFIDPPENIIQCRICFFGANAKR